MHLEIPATHFFSFPGAEITHIDVQNRGTYSIKVELETERSKYRYLYKHHGIMGAIDR
jgi:hypothetical protein